MRKIALLLTLVLFTGVAFCQAGRGPSTPEERARFLKFFQDYEANPLNDSNKSERQWAFKWLADIPDITVSLCSGPLEDVLKEKSKNDKGGMVLFYTFGAAAYIIEHPEMAKNEVAVAQAGMESMIRAYDNVLKVDSKAKLKSMEELKKKATDGQLQQVATTCKS